MSVKMKFGSKDIPFVYKGDKLIYPNPIKDGLLLWYDFKGMRNTDTNKEVAKDLSLNGNDGTLTNFNFTEGSGYKDNTLVFDGVDDSLTIPELELDETAMTVMHDGEIYSYEDDKVIKVNKYSGGDSAEFDGIKVGGRNLILDSSNIQSRSMQVGVTTEKVTDMGYTNVLKINNPDLKSYFTINKDSYAEYPMANKDFTLSFLVRGIADENSAKTLTVYYNASTMYTPMKGEIKEDEYSWVSVTFNTDDNVPSNHIGVSSFKELYFAKMKVEMGNKALDWTPAPEDFQTTSLSSSSLSNLQLYNRPLRKNELLHNAESKGLKELVDGVIVQDGLLIHYDFSHESNTSEYKDKAFDYSGNGNHGELQNFNFTEESGYVGNKLKFDGVDDRVLMISPGVESKAFLSSEMTVVWSGIIRETQPKSGINQILSAGYVSGWALGYHGVVDSLMYTVRDSNASSGYHIRYLNRPSFGEFFTFAMAFKNGEVTVYLNGVERNKVVNTGDIIYSTYPAVELTSSAQQTTASCKIYNRALTLEEIAHNYQIEKEKFDITEGDV